MTEPPTLEALPIDVDLWRLAVGIRRDLHAHPELRFAEHRTAAMVAAELGALGYDVTEGVAGTGVVAYRAGNPDGPHIAIRADMDALPVVEKSLAEYRSTIPNVMHACGHHVHIATAITVARLVAARRMLPGSITFIFQPAEEIPFGEVSGAQAMLDSGSLDLSGVDAVLGLHCWPGLPVGMIGVDASVAMAAKDAFKITVYGKGAHAATPSLGVDALLTACQLVNALHHIASRRLDSHETATLNVGTIHGGFSQSVLASSVELTGTIRTVDEAVRARLRLAIDAAVAGSATTSATAIDLEWANEMPAVQNDAGLVDLALRLLPDVVGPRGVVTITEPPMTTDDFALFARRVPSLYLKLGIRPAEQAVAPPLHAADFDVDERAIAFGAASLDVLAMTLLAGGIERS